jgi:hypothetical protein
MVKIDAFRFRDETSGELSFFARIKAAIGLALIGQQSSLEFWTSVCRYNFRGSPVFLQNFSSTIRYINLRLLIRSIKCVLMTKLISQPLP